MDNASEGYELATWLIMSAVKAMAFEALSRGAITPAQAIQAVVNGVEMAVEKKRRLEDQSNAGH